MCQYASWKEYEGQAYFLTNADLETKEGKNLLAPDYIVDIKGHGAIEHYYPELKGKGCNKECTDFSSPKNFPPALVKAIIEGRMSRIGIALDVLNEEGKALYDKAIATADKAYDKAIATAYEAYSKAIAPAREAYNKATATAYEAYNKARATAFSAIVTQKKYRTKAWK
jgi:hypothetical protein